MKVTVKGETTNEPLNESFSVWAGDEIKITTESGQWFTLDLEPDIWFEHFYLLLARAKTWRERWHSVSLILSREETMVETTLIDCPVCGQKGLPSVHLPMCTACANFQRLILHTTVYRMETMSMGERLKLTWSRVVSLFTGKHG